MNNFCIIIPTYNNLLLTKEAIDSVRCQSVQDFNIIITDDSTNDDIRDYVDSISDQRIRYYANKPSLGAVRNWNKGLELADGKYVILLHHDEKMMGEKYLKELLSDFRKGYSIIISRVIVQDTKGVKRRYVNKLTNFFASHPRLLFVCNTIGPCSAIAFEHEKMKMFDTRLHWLVDVDWYYHLLNGQNIYYDRHIHIISQHGHADQISMNIDRKAMIKQDCEILNAKYNNLFRYELLAYQLIQYFKEIIKRLV